ncbi:MAG: type II toxin-antitoxin system Phd/YefM family antitoxin [candidate division KSB1 bacterium]|nr:type II toxin-antitoxin system Phd/YefM family antitoxin [candidate division KSB1 bacterium]
MAVKIMPISDARQKITEVVEAVATDGEPVYITHYSRPRAVLVGYEDYEALLSRLEDLEDLLSIRQGHEEPSRPYEEFLAEIKAE